MTRPQHVCPNKGCRGYALGSDDEQEGAQRHRKRGDAALVLLQRLQSCFARKIADRRKSGKSHSSPQVYRKMANCDGLTFCHVGLCQAHDVAGFREMALQ